MAHERRIEDYEAWRAALLPRVRAIRCELRNAREQRPPCTRVKAAEELRELHRCRRRRKARLAAAGVLVQTGPRAWRLTLPSVSESSVPLPPEGQDAEWGKEPQMTTDERGWGTL